VGALHDDQAQVLNAVAMAKVVDVGVRTERKMVGMEPGSVLEG
jgi:hypothetical protein